METLRDGWQSYAREVLPPDAGRTQYVETRRAFYAGAFVALCLMGKTTEAGTTDEQAEAAFRGWLAEAIEFANSVGTFNEGGRPQ